MNYYPTICNKINFTEALAYSNCNLSEFQKIFFMADRVSGAWRTVESLISEFPFIECKDICKESQMILRCFLYTVHNYRNLPDCGDIINSDSISIVVSPFGFHSHRSCNRRYYPFGFCGYCVHLYSGDQLLLMVSTWECFVQVFGENIEGSKAEKQFHTRAGIMNWFLIDFSETLPTIIDKKNKFQFF